MRKLYILKAIVDFIWIMSVITLPLITIFFGIAIYSDGTIDIPIKINTIEIDLANGNSRFILPLVLVQFGLFICILYFFRKLLENFKQRMIFKIENIALLNKIGKLIMINAIIYALFTIALPLMTGELKLEIGYGPFLYVLVLGLFFTVLSEVFMMGKRLQEENDLTL